MLPVRPQSDEGDTFYVMERGTIGVYEGGEHKTTLYSVTSFGDTRAPRRCRTRYFCKLWGIGRAVFRAIMGQFKRGRMEVKV